MENDFMRFFTNSYFTIITRLMEEEGEPMPEGWK